ncbi:MAG TPA: glucosaminidase domain-containing protein, partial [Ruminiclostridium sp.]|nr:glucosaminidase domain-containing protein [Ruminiclostridium sp.]
LSHYGISHLDIYMDNYSYMGTVSYDSLTSRSDVVNAFNGAAGYSDLSHIAYSYTLKDGSVSPGRHTVRVAAIDNKGNIAWSESSFTFDIPDIHNNLDNPSGTYGGDVKVSGWALSHYGISRLDIYMDNYIYKGSVSYDSLTSRSDVVNAFNGADGYSDLNHIGYSYTLKDDDISSGKHTVRVAAIDNKGNVAWSESSFTFNIPDIHNNLDNPSGTYCGDIKVSGWALSHYGISRMDIYMDNYTFLGTVGHDALTSRSDVVNAFNGANGYSDLDHIAYSYTIKDGSITTGNHTIRTAAIDNNGNVTWSESSFTYTIPSDVMALDFPKDISLNDNFSIGGWAMSHFGILKADISIDDKTVATIQHDSFVKRSDVVNAYGGANGYSDLDHIGFSYKPDQQLSNGTHTVKVTVTDAANKTNTVTRNFTVYSKYNTVNLNNIYLTDKSNITGYAYDYNNVDHVEVYVDGEDVGAATFGLASPDFAAQYPGVAKAANAGYSFDVSKLGSLSFGNHTLKTVEVGKDGISTDSNTATIIKSQSLMIVDSPAQGYQANTSPLQISGWALPWDGTKSVSIYVDGSSAPAGNATTGIARSDVAAAYTGCNEPNSGFSYSLDISALDPGQHSVKIVVAGNQGSSQSITVDFRIPVARLVIFPVSGDTVASANGTSTSTIDPATIINNGGLYQFISLKTVQGFTADELAPMLKDCGVLEGHEAAFLDAANKYNLNPIYLIAHARWETGNGTSHFSKGVVVNGATYYNLFGICAFDNSPEDAGTYAAKQGWDSIDKAIYGGAAFISNSYVNTYTNSKHGYDQETLYEMRWNPEGIVLHGYATCEYATDSNWANGIANIIKQYAYLYNGKTISYIIPVYQ